MQENNSHEPVRESKKKAIQKIHNLENQIEDLEESEVRYRMLVDGIFDYAVFTIDPKGYIQTWNPGAENMKLYTAEEVIGQHFSLLYPEEGRKNNEPMDHLREALEKGFYRGTGSRQKKNGDLFTADVYIRPIFKDGVHLGFAKVVSNLDEDQKLEAEIDKKEKQINQLRDEKNERENYVSMLSHDLRSPLTAAKLNASLIITRINQMVSNLDRLDSMIKDLLDVNRMQAGQTLKLETRECDLTAILRHSLANIKLSYPSQIKIYAPEEVIGFWDEKALIRVFENLISNAVKYGSCEEDIFVKVENKESNAKIEITNLGDVIAENDLKNIFDQYRRLEKHSHIAGWGLGLALVKGIVGQHGGEIEVNSDKKQGTTFVISLPKKLS